MGLFEDLLAGLYLLVTSQEVWLIAGLSLFVSIVAVLLSTIIGIPIGTVWGLKKGRSGVFTASILNTGMGLPPVLVGLIVYLLLARKGPFGILELLFTPTAMIIAQFILTLPIIIGITRSTVRDLPDELPEMLASIGASPWQIRWQLIQEARSGMLVAIIVALGRAFSEVGAIYIVGGNIRYRTRVLTTAILTEVSKGDRATALAFGILLLSISFSLTTLMTYYQVNSRKSHYN